MSLRYRTISLAVVAGCVLLIAGCAAKRVVLVPAPTATIAQNNTVKAEQAGVTMLAEPNAWNGTPADLADRVTPLKVTIRNHSGHPLRIEYDNIALVGPNDQTYAALPPADIHGSSYSNAQLREPGAARVVPAAYAEPQKDDKPNNKGAQSWKAHGPHGRPGRVVIVPQFGWGGYYVAPYWGYAYPGLGWWPYGWAPNYRYYDGYWPSMQRVQLPTQSMLQKAIPEGVISNGGYVSGFLLLPESEGRRPQGTGDAQGQTGGRSHRGAVRGDYDTAAGEAIRELTLRNGPPTA